MLETAFEAKCLGQDVVVGYVHPVPPHSDLSQGAILLGKKIDFLLRGFDTIPSLAGTMPGRARGWFDVAAALRRAPATVLIDAPIPVAASVEGATASNLQIEIWRRAEEVDVMELLLAGIDVWVGVRVLSTPSV
jgi:K+-sensing histidine kinase KdpD